MTEGIEMQEEVLLWARYVDQQLMSRVCAHLVVVGPDDSTTRPHHVVRV